MAGSVAGIVLPRTSTVDGRVPKRTGRGGGIKYVFPMCARGPPKCRAHAKRRRDRPYTYIIIVVIIARVMLRAGQQRRAKLDVTRIWFAKHRVISTCRCTNRGYVRFENVSLARTVCHRFIIHNNQRALGAERRERPGNP